MDDNVEGHGWRVEIEGKVEVKRSFQIRFQRDKYEEMRVAPDNHNDLEAKRSKARRLRRLVLEIFIGLCTSMAGAAVWHFWLG